MLFLAYHLLTEDREKQLISTMFSQFLESLSEKERFNIQAKPFIQLDKSQFYPLYKYS